VEPKVPETAKDSWVVPAKHKNKINPYKDDVASLSTGKSLYKKHCTSCHGKKDWAMGRKPNSSIPQVAILRSLPFKNKQMAPFFTKQEKAGTICRDLRKRYPMRRMFGLLSIILERLNSRFSGIRCQPMVPAKADR
jgi:cytochrome c1